MIASIPVKTVSTLNMREHWRRKADRAREHRHAARVSLLALAETPALPAVVTLVRVSPRPLDDDNLRGALKSVRDGVADFLGVDDRDPRVRWEYGQKRGGTKVYAVEVEVGMPRKTRTE